MLSSFRLPRASPSLARAVSCVGYPRAIPALSFNAISKSKALDASVSPPAENEHPWSSIFHQVSSDVPPRTLYPIPAHRRRNRIPNNFFSSTPSRRRFHTSARAESKKRKVEDVHVDQSDSRASSKSDSPWDHIFENISPTVPASTASRRPPSLSLTPQSRANIRRRQAMSKSELAAFNEMFDMIFSALGDKAAASASTPTVGSRMLRRAPHTLDGDEAQLDKQKEEMELCHSDHDLMRYSLRTVFSPDAPVPPNGSRVLAHLLHLLHTKFSNPNLALTLFAYARDANVSTYVALCGAPVYAEVMRIQWGTFRDLGAVRATLEEMSANAVDMGKEVQRVVYAIRRDLSGAQCGQVIVDGKVCGTGPEEKEVWETVERCEMLVQDGAVRVVKDGRLHLDEWKTGRDDGKWSFGYEDNTASPQAA